ncbi:MAG: DUF2029 domain-containing protein, partial [Chloroflexota bacterium]
MPHVPTRRSALDAPGVRTVLALGAVIGLVIGLSTFILHARLDPFADVHAYYDAGARLNAGRPLYEQPAGTDDADFYRYPPLLAIAFRPLALLPFETAAWLWEAVLLALFAATVIRMGLRNRWTWLTLGWLAAPVAWSLVIGQAQVAVTFLLAMGSPLGVATATHLKLLPALVAVFWIARRDWASFGRFVGWTVGLGVLSFVLEPAGSIAFLGFTDLAQVGNVENRSLFAISPVLWVGSTAILVVLAYRFAASRAGWALAVAASVFASPRLLLYQLSTLMATVPRG